jgi:virulence factor Mce-like protein
MSGDLAIRGPVAPRSRWSLESLEESKLARSLLGLALILITLAIMVAIGAAFTGHFTNVVTVNSELPAGSNAVVIGAPVEYRYVTVGKVASEGHAPDGRVSVKLDIYPAKRGDVPSNVQTQVAPLSIFGNQYVDLTLPARAAVSATPVAAGQFIQPYTAAPSTSLQGSVTQIYNLLEAVHPADLDTALTAIATALSGEGTSLGQALVQGNQYLAKVNPHLQTLEQDLRLLTPVSQAATAAAPDVVGILSNSIVTGQTVTSDANQIRQFLAEGTTAVGQLAGVLDQTQSSLPTLVNGSAPLLRDVANSPQLLAQTLSGLEEWASAWAAAKGPGPYLSVNAVLPVQNISDAVNAALGYQVRSSLAGALGSAYDPAPYTPADCPQYPGLTNPYCSGGSPAGTSVTRSSTAVAAASTAPAPAASPASHGASSPISSAATATTAPSAPNYPFAQELVAAQNVGAALNGGRTPASPAMATIFLVPLLTAMSSSS